MSSRNKRIPDDVPSDYADYADALGLLARIHDREADRELIAGLRGNAIALWLGGFLTTPRAIEAAAAFGRALDEFPEPLGERELDLLAAEYADIYLVHAYRVSPSGSVWLTEDHLERQEPMFELRKWYHHYGVKAPDWRQRPDDHIVHQLQFAVQLIAADESHTRADAARFLDAGLLKWIGEWASRIVTRSASGFYRASAELTAAIVEELRDALARTEGVARPQPDPEPASRAKPVEMNSEGPFFPGQAESW